MSWKKADNEHGFTFYVNETTNATQWDHPKYANVKQKVNDCNYIKYPNYRVASKFRALQNALYMDDIPLSIIAGVFDRHRLGATENTLCLESYDIEAVLSDIFFAANKQNHTSMDVDLATELMINFLYNIYDKDRKTNIPVICAKLVLAVLSNAQLLDIYRFIFQLCCDHNNCVTRLRLQSLLSKLSDITNYLHENTCFGRNFVNRTIEKCFLHSPGLVGMNEASFVEWLMSEPDFLSWLPILHRLKQSETVMNSSKCTVCRMTPMIGLRYRCIKCTRYIQCQQCFLTGRVSSAHKLSHPMKEYSTNSSTGDCTFGLIKKICAIVKTRKDVPCLANTIVKPARNTDEYLSKTVPKEVVSNSDEPLSSPMVQLQIIIRQLEIQNLELQQMIMSGNRGEKEIKRYLEEHNQHVAGQINKLKILKEYLKSSPTQCTQPAPTNLNFNGMASTPFVTTGKVPKFNLDTFSPILNKHQELSNIREDLDNHYEIMDKKSQWHQNYPDVMSNTQASFSEISQWYTAPPNFDCQRTFDVVDHPRVDTEQIVENGQSDLDEALAKLQQILANNLVLDGTDGDGTISYSEFAKRTFCVQESLGTIDNGQLKTAVNEVEDMLTTFIDNVETTKFSSLPQGHNCNEIF